MRNFKILYIILTVGFLLTACSDNINFDRAVSKSFQPMSIVKDGSAQQELNDEETYQIVSAVYQIDNQQHYVDEILQETIVLNKDIKLRYPQISNLNDKAKEKYINKLIEVASIGALVSYRQYDYSADIDYTVTLANKNTLSIIFYGLVCPFGTAHPEKYFYAVSIDLASGAFIDIEEQLGDELISRLSELNYQWTNGVIEPSKEEYVYLLKTYPHKYYLTEIGLGISVEVPFAFGGHIEFEIPYTELGENEKLLKWWIC